MAQEPKGAEGSARNPKTLTDPGSGEPQPGAPPAHKATNGIRTENHPHPLPPPLRGRGRIAGIRKRPPGSPAAFPAGSGPEAYFVILETTPEPTVRPPSRMAKRRPWSMAIGVISSMFSSTLSPGITISTPSFSFTIPVTSVVRK